MLKFKAYFYPSTIWCPRSR